MTDRYTLVLVEMHSKMGENQHTIEVSLNQNKSRFFDRANIFMKFTFLFYYYF